MTRTTQTELNAVFRNYMRALWARGADVEGLTLVKHMSGYRIERVHADAGYSHSTPFGNVTLPAAQMVAAMRHALDAVSLLPQLRATSGNATVLLAAPELSRELPDNARWTHEELHGTPERSEAEVLARVTGSVAATVRHEHRDAKTGELVVDSEHTWDSRHASSLPDPNSDEGMALRASCDLVSSCTREADGALDHPRYGTTAACAFHAREQKLMTRLHWYAGRRMTKWALISDDERASLDATSCGLKCSGCGEELKTEGDFARHYTLKRSEYLNLGDCPNNPRPSSW